MKNYRYQFLAVPPLPGAPLPASLGLSFLRLELRALPRAGRPSCSQLLLICISLHGLKAAKPSPAAKRQAKAPPQEGGGEVSLLVLYYLDLSMKHYQVVMFDRHYL